MLGIDVLNVKYFATSAIIFPNSIALHEVREYIFAIDAIFYIEDPNHFQEGTRYD